MTMKNDRPDLPSEGEPDIGKTVNVKRKLMSVMRHRRGSNPGLTDRLIVGRNVTLTLRRNWTCSLAYCLSAFNSVHQVQYATNNGRTRVLQEFKFEEREHRTPEILDIEAASSSDWNNRLLQNSFFYTTFKFTKCNLKIAYHLQICIVQHLWNACSLVNNLDTNRTADIRLPTGTGIFLLDNKTTPVPRFTQLSTGQQEILTLGVWIWLVT
jgi:hypothetical protein